MANRILTTANIIVGLALLTAAILANQDNILGFMQRYADVVLTISVFIVYLVLLIGAAYLGRRSQKRKNSLRSTAKELAELRMCLNRAVTDMLNYAGDDYNYDPVFQLFKNKWSTTGELLSNLAIPYPAIESADEFGVVTWTLYLDMLFPLAVTGDLEEARLVLLRVEEKPVDTFQIALERWKFWR